MAWIESHDNLKDHPKTRRAARLLGVSVPTIIGHLHLLWHWCLSYAEDGDLSGYDAADIAEAVMWDGDPDQLIEALINCGPAGKAGFLERDAQGRLLVHDWHDYAGKLIEKREEAREAGARGNHERWHVQRGIVDPTCPYCQEASAQDGQVIGSPSGGESGGDSQPESEPNRVLSHRTVPNRTVPNSTNKEYTCAPDGARAYTAPSPGGSVEAEKVTATPDGDKLSEKSGPRSPFKSKRQEQLFDEFWAQYPKKRSKGQAERAWAKITPDDALFRYILDGLERAKRSRDWIKDAGAYIPYPATWLNAKGWEDDYEEVRSSGNAHRGHRPYTEDDGYDWDRLARRS